MLYYQHKDNVMNRIKIALGTLLLTLPMVALSAPANAATAHNSQAGGIGSSSNAGDSTVGSRHVKHSAKHMAM